MNFDSGKLMSAVAPKDDSSSFNSSDSDKSLFRSLQEHRKLSHTTKAVRDEKLHRKFLYDEIVRLPEIKAPVATPKVLTPVTPVKAIEPAKVGNPD